MFRLFRKQRSGFTADDFRIDQQEPIKFSISSEENDNQENVPSQESAHSKVVPAHDLATLSRKKNKRVYTPSWPYRALFCLFASHFLLSTYHSVWPQLGRILLAVTTSVVARSDLRCDSHRSVFSYIIPSRHDFASTQTGAVIASRLTTPGIESDTLSGNPAGACWSFRGNSGTFGVALSSQSVIPSHVVIQHQPEPSNSTAQMSRAPRQVIVWGLVDGEKNIEAYHKRWREAFALALVRRPPFPMREGLFIPLAEFEFDITAQSLRQTFPLFDEVRSWGMDFSVIVFQVHSNWGADVTSLCSVHIYGCTNNHV